MNKEFGMISHELAWMPQGSFDSFSAGSGSHYSYKGEDKVHPLSFPRILSLEFISFFLNDYHACNQPMNNDSSLIHLPGLFAGKQYAGRRDGSLRWPDVN